MENDGHEKEQIHRKRPLDTVLTNYPLISSAK